MYTDGTLRVLRAQERELVFEAFDAADAWGIAALLIEAAQKESRPIALQAVLDGFDILRYFMPGTGAKNAFWMAKKYNTVCKTGVSSLATAVEQALSQHPPTGWQCDGDRYALCGGGFPIRIRGQGIVGVYCISGLPHLEDHRVLTTVLAQYLGKPPSIVPVEAEL